MTRIALGIEYNGHGFSGWQAQQNLHTVQGVLEAAISKVANEPIQTFCAGRTDAGVHAANQVIHFDTSSERELKAWTFGVNANLPANISVAFAKEVDEKFHARFSATARRYRYVILNQKLRSALHAGRVTLYPYELDVELMQAAGKYLIGENDFSSFRSAQCESRTAMRNMHEISVTRQNNFVIVEIQANAFLHHMVRNIVGVLLRVGKSQISPETMLEILNAKDRKKAFETAPASGLYLIRVFYPEIYGIPALSIAFPPPKTL